MCVRVRARARDTGPGSRPTYDIELHRGQGAKKTFSLCPSPLFPPLPLKERPSSLERRKKERILSFFPFLFPQAVDEIRDEGEIGAVKGGVIWKSNYEKERRIIEIIAGN